MDANLKKVLIGMAAGALGFAMVGCGGDGAEATEGDPAVEESTGGEASCGAGSCGGATDDGAGDMGAGDLGAEGGDEGGEGACGAGSCGGEE